MSTSRLTLAPVAPGDLTDLIMLHADPQVAYWTGPWTRVSNAAWVADMVRRWDEQGVGKWMARTTDGGDVVGRGGLTRFDLDGEAVLELGWTVRDALTGRGYATEIGRAAIDWAAVFEPEVPVVAFTEVHNHASQAVMRRVGLQPAGVIRREGLVEDRDGLHPDASFALFRQRSPRRL